MNIHVNGEPHQVNDGVTLEHLLNELGYQGCMVAVAVNRSCIRRSELAATTVKAGDEVDILAPMAGG